MRRKHAAWDFSQLLSDNRLRRGSADSGSIAGMVRLWLNAHPSDYGLLTKFTPRWMTPQSSRNKIRDVISAMRSAGEIDCLGEAAFSGIGRGLKVWAGKAWFNSDVRSVVYQREGRHVQCSLLRSARLGRFFETVRLTDNLGPRPVDELTISLMACALKNDAWIRYPSRCEGHPDAGIIRDGQILLVYAVARDRWLKRTIDLVKAFLDSGHFCALMVGFEDRDAAFVEEAFGTEHRQLSVTTLDNFVDWERRRMRSRVAVRHMGKERLL